MNSIKVCNRCGLALDVAHFLRRNDAPDGLDYRCRLCEAKRRADYRQRNLEKELERGRAYAAVRRADEPDLLNSRVRTWRKTYPEKSRGLSARRRELFPEMKRAHDVVSGKKLRRTGLHAHHWSYNEGHITDVIYLTRKDHKGLHATMVYDQGKMMFRLRATGNLLDTRQSHIDAVMAMGGKVFDR